MANRGELMSYSDDFWTSNRCLLQELDDNEKSLEELKQLQRALIEQLEERDKALAVSARRIFYGTVANQQ